MFEDYLLITYVLFYGDLISGRLVDPGVSLLDCTTHSKTHTGKQ